MAAEKIVTFEVDGQRVVGTLRLAAPHISPIVLLLHGFGGSRDELVMPQTGIGIFAYVAAKLEPLGFSSLRIDFRGSGESDGKFEDTTYTRQIADCTAAMEFIANLPSVDENGIILLGWSQGGLVAAVAAGRTNRPAGVALWAAVGEPTVSFPNLIGHDAYERGLQSHASTEVRMPWGASLTLGHDFFVDVDRLDPLREIASYAGPVFIAEGSLDTAIPVGTAQKFARAHRGPNQVWVAPMDHAFSTSSNVEMLEGLVAATANFFAPLKHTGGVAATRRPGGRSK